MVTECELKNHTLMCVSDGYRCLDCGAFFPLGYFSKKEIVMPEIPLSCPHGSCAM